MVGRTPRLTFIIVGLILLSAFWTTVWHGIDRSVLTRVPILDEAIYLQRGAELSQQGWLPDSPFTMSPLYSYLVALTGSGRTLTESRLRSGGPPLGIRVLQTLLWLAIAWLLWRVGRDLLGYRWAWAPALLWLGYGPAGILACQILLEIPLVFVATSALAISGGHVGPRSIRGRALACGVLIGAAFLFRGTAVVLVVPVIMALLPDRSAGSWRSTVVPLASALILTVLPFTVLNSTRAGRLIPPALNGGINLYIGNGPGADGLFRTFAGYDLETDPSGAEYLSRESGREISDAWTADQIWASKGRAAMLSDPVRALGLWIRKMRLHLVGVEIPQISAFSAWLRSAPPLRVLIVPWAFLAAFGLAGGFLVWRRQRLLRPWLLAALLLIAVQSLFFVVTRYRLILVPTLALATVALIQDLSKRRGRGLVGGGAAVALAGLVVWPWGMSDVLRNFEVGGLDNEAVRWEHLAASLPAEQATLAQNHLAEAETLYRKSIAIADQRSDSWQGLGRVLWRSGKKAQAAQELTTAVELVSAPQALRRDLIGMLMRQDQSAAALPHLKQALATEPDNADLLHHSAVALAENGSPQEAAAAARRLMTAHPGDARGYFDLGVVLAQAGRLQEARDVFAAGLRQVPDHPELSRNLARVLQMLDR